MTIETTAIVRNGKLELINGAAAALTEGMEVRVSITPVQPAQAAATGAGEDVPFFNPLADVIGIGEGPIDTAENHDHYIYGFPKKKA